MREIPVSLRAPTLDTSWEAVEVVSPPSKVIQALARLGQDPGATAVTSQLIQSMREHLGVDITEGGASDDPCL